MPELKMIADVTSFLANAITIVTGSLAVYIFVKKGPAIAAALNLLINFAFQTTLNELREKLERLNEYHAADTEENEEIVNIFHELHGQINGNSRVLSAMPEIADKLDKMLKSTKTITEPRKRAMVSQIREKLKSMNVENLSNFAGEGR
jgi:hypothetical protein